ncbi:hypothetical protein FPV67DRAFT_1563408 [Lyophyllum atratum]|nr:hypothetical protein FPV67DRAFT_1563408 [Lyophyllum atratum]
MGPCQSGYSPRARADPLIHHGRHFGRAVYAFANVRAIITNGLEHMSQEDDSLENYTAKERQEHNVFLELLKLCPGLEQRLVDPPSSEQIYLLADLIQKGASASRGDDTKGMKAAVIDWITPPGENLNPPLSRRDKTHRGFRHEVTGALLCPTGMDWNDAETKQHLSSGEAVVAGHSWPVFLYENSTFDGKDPWKGLLRSQLLLMAFKHVFISPSAAAASDASITTRSGNARIHGMTRVTKASLVYVATQVRFALSSAHSWSRTDKVTDSETFYTTLLTTLDHPQNITRVDEILKWWDRHVPLEEELDSSQADSGS